MHGKDRIEKLVPPLRSEITTKQQPKGGRMIVDDHDMPDRLATYGYKSRSDRETSLLSSRSGVRQSVGSNHHHSSFKRWKIDISENLWTRAPGVLDALPISLDAGNQRESY